MNRFDIIEGHYLFCRDYHGGMGCKLYERLCRIQRYYHCGPWFDYESLSGEGREVYDNLVSRRENETQIALTRYATGGN